MTCLHFCGGYFAAVVWAVGPGLPVGRLNFVWTRWRNSRNAYLLFGNTGGSVASVAFHPQPFWGCRCSTGGVRYSSTKTATFGEISMTSSSACTDSSHCLSISAGWKLQKLLPRRKRRDFGGIFTDPFGFCRISVLFSGLGFSGPRNLTALLMTVAGSAGDFEMFRLSSGLVLSAAWQFAANA